MGDVLLESSNRAYRSPFAKAVPIFNRSTDSKYFADIKDMMDTATESTFLTVTYVENGAVLNLCHSCQEAARKSTGKQRRAHHDD